MQITFDAAKSERNRRERGFGFAHAAKVFAGQAIFAPARTVDGETRMKAIGDVEGEVYAVIFVDRGNVRRIISARPASRRERREWRTSG